MRITCVLCAYAAARVAHRPTKTDVEVIITGSIRVYCICACNLPRVRFWLAEITPFVPAPANHSTLPAVIPPRDYSFVSAKVPVQFDLQIPIDQW